MRIWLQSMLSLLSNLVFEKKKNAWKWIDTGQKETKQPWYILQPVFTFNSKNYNVEYMITNKKHSCFIYTYLLTCLLILTYDIFGTNFSGEQTLNTPSETLGLLSLLIHNNAVWYAC